MPWNKDNPAGTQKIRLSDEELRANFAALETALSAEHSFSGGTPTGIHGTLSAATLTAPTIADFTNATHDHGDADDGGSTLESPTIVTPTIASFTNATHDHDDAAGGGNSLGAISATDVTLIGGSQTPPDANTLTTDNIIGAHCVFNGVTPAFTAQVNFTGAITVHGDGDYTLLINRDFAAVNYTVLCQSKSRETRYGAVAVGSIQITIGNSSGTPENQAHISVALIGPQ